MIMQHRFFFYHLYWAFMLQRSSVSLAFPLNQIKDSSEFQVWATLVNDKIHPFSLLSSHAVAILIFPSTIEE